MAAREGVTSSAISADSAFFESPAMDGRVLLSRETDLTWDKGVNE